VKKDRFLILLVAFMVFIILESVLIPFPFGSMALDIASIILFFSCINAISDTKSHFRIAALLFLGAGLSKSIPYLIDDPFYTLLSMSCGFVLSAVFYLYTAVLIIIYVLKEGRVTRDKIAAAICVYVILGITWGMLFSLVATLDPGALGGGFASGPSGSAPAMYFSFVTLTTVGYGDIAPVSSTARALVMVEGIVGQIYIAVMIARLVALYTTHSTKNNA